MPPSCDAQAASLGKGNGFMFLNSAEGQWGCFEDDVGRQDISSAPVPRSLNELERHGPKYHMMSFICHCRWPTSRGFILTVPEARRRNESPPASPTPDDDDLSIIGEGDSDTDDADDDNNSGAAPGPAVAAAAPAPAVVAPAPAVVAPAPVNVGPAPVAVAPAPVAVAPAPVAAVAPAPVAVVPAAAPALPPAPPAPAAATPSATVGHSAPPTTVPAASAIIGGLNSFPAGTPPPVPTSAVFCVAGAGARYYTITCGIRVGVYDGWQNVAPYVIGVANASYSRHATISSAYEAYIAAFNRGFVSYA